MDDGEDDDGNDDDSKDDDVDDDDSEDNNNSNGINHRYATTNLVVRCISGCDGGWVISTRAMNEQTNDS